MQDGSSIYDIFFIYHPEDIDFTRRLAEQLTSQNVVCRFDEEFGESRTGPQSLREAALRSHTIAIVLTPDSAESQLCNELVEYSVTNGKRFISLIVNEDIAVDVHPAIAENAYVFFRDEDDHESSISTLVQLLQVDAHLRLHTELLVSASKWNLEQRTGELLPQDRAEEARQWLADGANRLPKPSQLLVEYIHASRRQKPLPSRGSPTLVALGLLAILIIVAVVGIVQNVMASQSAATATAVYLATSEQQTRTAHSIAATATAESNSAAQVISNLAATSAHIRDVVLATAAAQAQIATGQAAMTATLLEATAMHAANVRKTEMAQLQSEIAAQAVVDGAKRTLSEGDLELALALAWEAAQTLEDPWPALHILRQVVERSPTATIDNISLSQIHPAGRQIALVPRSSERVLVFDAKTGLLAYEIEDHDDDISAIAYSGDGQLLITAAQDGEVVIRSSEDGAARYRLHEHEGPMRAIAMVGAESKMVTAGQDGLFLWDLNSGESLASFAPEPGDGLSITELMVTADDARLLVWSNAGGKISMAQYSPDTLELLSPDTEARVYLGYDRSGSIAYSGGRGLPAYAGDPNTGDLILWNPSTGEQLTRLSEGFTWSLISGGSIASATDSLEFIAFGESAALLGVKNSIGEHRSVLVGLEDGAVLRTFDGELAAGLVSADFLDSETVLSLTSDNLLVTWSTTEGRLIRQVGFSPQPLARIEVDARGTIALGQAIDGTLYFWSLAPMTSNRPRALDESADDITINQAGAALLISGDIGTRLEKLDDNQILFRSEARGLTQINETGSHFAISADRQIQLVDAENGQTDASWTVDSDAVTNLHLAPNGETLLVETEGDQLLLLRSGDDELQQLNTGGFGETRLARFTADGSAFLTLHPEGALLWLGDDADPAGAYALGLAPEFATPDRFSVAFSDTGDRLYFFVRLGGGLAGLTVISLDEDSIQRQTFVDVAYGELTPDGKYLLLARVDGSVQVIDTTSAESLHEFTAGGVSVRSIALLEERNWLYTAVDKNLLIWDLASKALVQGFQHPDNVLGFSLSHDGLHVVTKDASGVYRLIRVETASELLGRVRERITPRELTCAEREQYLALPFCE